MRPPLFVCNFNQKQNILIIMISKDIHACWFVVAMRHDLASTVVDVNSLAVVFIFGAQPTKLWQVCVSNSHHLNRWSLIVDHTLFINVCSQFWHFHWDTIFTRLQFDWANVVYFPCIIHINWSTQTQTMAKWEKWERNHHDWLFMHRINIFSIHFLERKNDY